jgi:hypothetical protein
MQFRSVLVGGSIFVAGLVVAACSGGSDGGGDATSKCSASGKRVCERACACGGGSKCKTGYRTAYGSATLTWSDVGDCEAGYAGSRCKKGDSPAVDYGVCMTKIDAAMCDGDVFVVPTECEEPRDSGQ